MSFLHEFQRHPRALVFWAALVLTGLIGWLDHATGWEWSVFMIYSFPISLVAWKTNRTLGFVFAILCAATWGATRVGSHPFQNDWAFVLAAINRWFFFEILVVAITAVKARRDIDATRIATLEITQGLERDLLTASERERQRIGRELHDTLGPHLAAVGYEATFLVDDLRRRAHPEAGEVEHLRERLAEALSIVRNIAHGISPAPMEGGGLSIALEDFARTTSHLTGMSVSYTEIGNPQISDSVDGLHFFRVAQEAVNNASKHGDARNVTIVLSRDGDFLRLTVANDGEPFVKPFHNARGIGLASMRSRALALGGELSIECNPGEGTIVSCQCPIRLPGSAVVAT